jgi:hypothetical protein
MDDASRTRADGEVGEEGFRADVDEQADSAGAWLGFGLIDVNAGAPFTVAVTVAAVTAARG